MLQTANRTEKCTHKHRDVHTLFKTLKRMTILYTFGYIYIKLPLKF